MEDNLIMANLLHPQAERLFDSLLGYTDEQTAEWIADKIHLTKTPTEKKRFEWAEGICVELTDTFDDETVMKIRMDCACGPGKGRMDEIKKIYDRATDLNDFAVLYNEAGFGSTVWIEANLIYFSYPTCYCSCVNKTDKPISKVWCYCTLGYTKKMFTYVLDCEVDVQLIESVKQGDSRCLMSIERKKS